MHTQSDIQSVEEIYSSDLIHLPPGPGVYAFWWIGDKNFLMQNANRKLLLAGPAGQRVTVELKDWWPAELIYPCLYVGKTTNVKKRFSQHIRHTKRNRLHEAHEHHHKQKPYNTSCQLRHGIEHIFPDEPSPIEMIDTHVGFSCKTNFEEHNAVAERFFEEDRLVGT